MEREVEMDDPFDLDRFVQAQDSGHTYVAVLEELRGGRKTSHWMWFVFPQIAGLGHSAMARRFAISSLAEATAYLHHEVLGARLMQCAGVVASTEGRSAEQIFGVVDAQKLHSSMTLFLRAAPDEARFAQVLDRYFEGRADAATDERLQEQSAHFR
jgi:uncharacterized protein (DUF1810 family)